MTITAPVAIPAASLPLPDPADRATFSARKLEQLRWANVNLAPGANALGAAAYDNALDASASAAAAQAAAGVASAATGAPLWVSGTSYADNASVVSPINRRNYRRAGAGAGTTDPSLDAANWRAATPVPAASFQLAYQFFGAL